MSGYLLQREKQWGIIVVTEQRVQVRPTRFRISDILVLVGQPPAGPIVQTPPFLCIEILSPTDRMAEMQFRIDDYLAFDVRYVWVIHPGIRRAFVHTAGRVQEVTDGILRTESPDIRIPLAELE